MKKILISEVRRRVKDTIERMNKMYRVNWYIIDTREEGCGKARFVTREAAEARANFLKEQAKHARFWVEAVEDTITQADLDAAKVE